MSDVKAKLFEVIADKLGKDVSEISPEKKFIDDLGADSLDLTELIMAMEEELDLDEIPEEASEKFVSVQDVIDYVESL